MEKGKEGVREKRRGGRKTGRGEAERGDGEEEAETETGRQAHAQKISIFKKLVKDKIN